MRNRTAIHKAAAAVVALVVAITVGACSGSPQPRSITLTFIRHAESQSNAANIINTDVPGPSLTEEGQAQAEQLAHQLSRNNFDGIYVSDMVRTQQTAQPLAHDTTPYTVTEVNRQADCHPDDKSNPRIQR